MYAEQHFHDQEEQDNGQQAADIAAYELYFLEQTKKAYDLLSCAAAQAGAHVLAEDLELVVQTYATLEGDATLADALADTVAEHVVSQHLIGRDAVLRQPLSHEGYRAVKRVLGHACRELESFLTAEAGR
jgi:hypothetical protein